MVRINYPTSLPRIGSEPYVSDDLIWIASADSHPTDAVPIDTPSLPLPEIEHVEDPIPVMDPAATAECKQPIPMTDDVAEEPSIPITSQEDTPAPPVSVSGDFAPSQAEDKIDVANVEALKNAGNQQIGGLSFIC